MHRDRGRQQGVDRRPGAVGGQFAPVLCHRDVDRQVRSEKPVSMPSAQASIRRAAAGFAVRLSATPLRSSPKVRTLMKSRSVPVSARNAAPAVRAVLAAQGVHSPLVAFAAAVPAALGQGEAMP